MASKRALQQRLEAVRRSTGLSQAAFGERLGLADRTYKNYELGIRDIPLRVAMDISEVFDTNLTWLLTGEGARSTPTIGEGLEAAVVAVRRHMLDAGKTPDPEKEAAIIRYVFEEILRDGGLDEGRVTAFLRTV